MIFIQYNFFKQEIHLWSHLIVLSLLIFYAGITLDQLVNISMTITDFDNIYYMKFLSALDPQIVFTIFIFLCFYYNIFLYM